MVAELGRLRPAELADLPDLLHIEHTCFSTDRISPRQWRYALTRARALCWVVVTEAGLVGYALGWSPRLPRPGRLYSLAILPEWQGFGLADALVRRLLQLWRQAGYTQVRLEVRADNVAAQHLYRRLGFMRLSPLPRYYADGADGERWSLSLTSPDHPENSV